MSGGFAYRITNPETGETKSVTYPEGREFVAANPGWIWLNSDKPLNAGFRRDRTASAVLDAAPNVGAGRPDTSQPLKSDGPRDACGFLIPPTAEPAAPVEPKVLATVTEYSDLLEVLRRRSAEISMTREMLDDVAGLQSGYAGKLLGRGQSKGLAKMSLGLVLQGLGLKLQVIEDREGMAATRRRIEAARPKHGRKPVTHLKQQSTQ